MFSYFNKGVGCLFGIIISIILIILIIVLINAVINIDFDAVFTNLHDDFDQFFKNHSL